MYYHHSFMVHNLCIVNLGAFQVVRLVQEAGMKADCKLYTTLISTCGKSGKVDAMFEVWYLSFWLPFLRFHQCLEYLIGCFLMYFQYVFLICNEFLLIYWYIILNYWSWYKYFHLLLFIYFFFRLTLLYLERKRTEFFITSNNDSWSIHRLSCQSEILLAVNLNLTHSCNLSIQHLKYFLKCRTRISFLFLLLLLQNLGTVLWNCSFSSIFGNLNEAFYVSRRVSCFHNCMDFYF